MKKDNVTQNIARIKVKFIKNLIRWQPTFTALFERTNSEEEQNLIELWPVVQMHAHKIAGSAGMFDFKNLGDCSYQVSVFLKESILSGNMDPEENKQAFIAMYSDFLDELSKCIYESLEGQLDQESPPLPQKASIQAHKVLMCIDKELKNTLVNYNTSFNQCELFCTQSGSAFLKQLKMTMEHSEDGIETIDNLPDLLVLDGALIRENQEDLLDFIKNDAHLSLVPIIIFNAKPELQDLIAKKKLYQSIIMREKNEDLAILKKMNQVLFKHITKILIADDDDVILDLLSGHFEDLRCLVFKASNGYDALMTMQIESPDLVMLDIMMPGMDGLTSLKQAQVSQSLAQIPIIIMSAKNHNETINKSLKLGAQDYITKPFDVKDVLHRVSGYLKNNLDEPTTITEK